MEQCGSHVCFLRSSRYNRHQHNINALARTWWESAEYGGVLVHQFLTTSHPKKSMGFTTWLGYIDGIHITYIYIYSSTMDHILIWWKQQNWPMISLYITLPSFGLNVVQNMDVSRWDLFQPTLGYASEKGWKLKHSKCRADFSLGQSEKQTCWKQETNATKLCVVIKCYPLVTKHGELKTGNLHASDVRGHNKLLSLFMHDPIILNPCLRRVKLPCCALLQISCFPYLAGKSPHL